MDTRFLKTLLNVIETGSISQTARQLNITPSAVVQRVKALEDEIGHPLLQRSGNAMRASPMATAALDHMRQLLSAERRLISAASSSFDSGLLRVGVVQSIQNGILPPILLGLQQDFPKIELRIFNDVSNTLYERVMTRDIDLAIITRPRSRLSKDVDWSELRREKAVLLARHDIAEDDPLALIQKEPFIRYDRNYWSGRMVDAWLRRKKLNVRELYELNSLDTIALLVNLGVGISVVPDWMPPWPDGVRLRKFALPDAPEREIGIIWSRASANLPLIQTFVNQAHSFIRSRKE
jgi:DNA-binding transcriptional LysR family regulator